MSLQDQGHRFIVRVVNGRIDGQWMHPSEVKPEWLDCTDMEDDVFASHISYLQSWLESRRECV